MDIHLIAFLIACVALAVALSRFREILDDTPTETPALSISHVEKDKAHLQQIG
jgi:hypothetical protein